jgi:tRNA/tmRNA/rRNA uracil-C5-methylase (TrmA/RlmC/RlmD family)
MVARHEGRVLFVPDAVPGERIRARVTELKKPFGRAETLSVVTASEHRRQHVWGAASVDRAPENRAGGAEFGHIALSHQRELKRRVLDDALRRFGGVETDVAVQALPGDDENDGLRWRTRVNLHVDADGRVGPYAARSHRVVPVSDLPLATAAVEETAPLIETFVGEREIGVLEPSIGGARLIIGKQKPTTIIERVGEREFRLDDGGFWQVHRSAASALSNAVQRAIDGARFDPRAANLDLYGGVGLFAAAVGDRFGRATRITTVESEERATEHAAENLAEWLGAQAVTARVDRYLSDLITNSSALERDRLRRGTIVLDPPRSGAGKDVVASLDELHPAQLVYVACDPVALARDLGLLRARGWTLDGLEAFDLFPNTHHVEAVATLSK